MQDQRMASSNWAIKVYTKRLNCCLICEYIYAWLKYVCLVWAQSIHWNELMIQLERVFKIRYCIWIWKEFDSYFFRYFLLPRLSVFWVQYWIVTLSVNLPCATHMQKYVVILYVFNFAFFVVVVVYFVEFSSFPKWIQNFLQSLTINSFWIVNHSTKKNLEHF